MKLINAAQLTLAAIGAVWTVALGAQQSAGTSSVSGVVVDDQDRPQPVRRAIVTLTGEGLRPSRGSITDDDGRFTFRDLPAGSFGLTVTRSGYVTSMFGAKRPGRPGTAIVVPANGSVANVVVRLWRGAVVSGTIRDSSGTPLSNVTVTAIPATRASPLLLSLSNNGIATNRQGQFRIFGLEPGRYYLLAAQRSIGPVVSLTDAEVDAVFDAVRRRTNARPQDVLPPAPASPDAFGYAPIFYPGVTSSAAATFVALAAGQEKNGIDWILQPVRTGAITGTLMRADGRPGAGGRVQLTDTATSLPGMPQPLASDVEVSADGTFRIPAIAPGTYRLVGRVEAALDAPPVAPAAMYLPPSSPQLWAESRITVSGSDVNAVSLVAGPGLTINGTVAFESRTTKAPTEALRVFLMPAAVRRTTEPTPLYDIGLVPPIVVGADGTFAIASAAPGRFRLYLSGPAIDKSSWSLLSAKLGDREIADGDFEISGSGTECLAIRFTDQRSGIEGELRTALGQPASDVFILVFPADPRDWVPNSRRVKAVRPGIGGAFQFPDLPPGAYLLTAITDVDEDDWQEPGFLEQLTPAALKVSVALGQFTRQDLRIGR